MFSSAYLRFGGFLQITVVGPGCTVHSYYKTRFIHTQKILNYFLYLLVKSHSEYLVTNPVQSVLLSNKRQRAKDFFEYFWLGMILRPEGSRNIFQVSSKSIYD